jgi:hypothetical protein
VLLYFTLLVRVLGKLGKNQGVVSLYICSSSVVGLEVVEVNQVLVSEELVVVEVGLRV